MEFWFEKGFSDTSRMYIHHTTAQPDSPLFSFCICIFLLESPVGIMSNREAGWQSDWRRLVQDMVRGLGFGVWGDRVISPFNTDQVPEVTRPFLFFGMVVCEEERIYNVQCTPAAPLRFQTF